MPRALLFLLVLSAALSSRALAQGLGLPQLGIQSSGACRQLSVKDLSSGAMVPVGCLDSSIAGWSLTPKRFQLPAVADPSSGGDISPFSVTPPGGFPYGLAEKAADAVDAMAYMPENLRPQLRLRQTPTDVSSHLNAALAKGKDVLLPPGDFYVADMITIPAKVCLRGAGTTNTRIRVGSNFNMAAPAVISFASSDASCLKDVEIFFNQNVNGGRAGLIQYPWALDIRNATRLRLDNVRISAAWNGINGEGNAGGMSAGLLEIGAFNVGIRIEGFLDFAHFDTIHCWPFGASTGNARIIYGDGETTCSSIGRAEGLDIKALGTFLAKLDFPPYAQPSVVARQIGWIQLDGDGARIVYTGGELDVAMVSSTKLSSNLNPSIDMGGGILRIGQARILGSAPISEIRQTDGRLSILGGVITNYSPNGQAASVSGGEFHLASTLLGIGDYGGSRTLPYISVTGTGKAKLTGNFALPRPAANTGTLVSIANDIRGHFVSGNEFADWGYSVPSTLTSGVYGPNGAPPIPWTPTLAFATQGDFAPTYTVQQGRIYPQADGFRFEGRLVFATNAYTSPSGGSRITGLPGARSGLDSMNFPITAAGAVFGSGYAGLSLVSSTTTADLNIVRHGSGLTFSGAATSVFPASTSGFDLRFSGFVPTR